MLVIFKLSSDQSIAINPDHVALVEYNVVGPNGRPLSKIVLDIQNADGSPKELLVPGAIIDVVNSLNKPGTK